MHRWWVQRRPRSLVFIGSVCLSYRDWSFRCSIGVISGAAGLDGAGARVRRAAGGRHRQVPDWIQGSRTLRRAVGDLGEYLVVRSSAVCEDGQDASWAGQLETVLGVQVGEGD